MRICIAMKLRVLVAAILSLAQKHIIQTTWDANKNNPKNFIELMRKRVDYWMETEINIKPTLSRAIEQITGGLITLDTILNHDIKSAPPPDEPSSNIHTP
jgi:hypothetical protein